MSRGNIFSVVQVPRLDGTPSEEKAEMPYVDEGLFHVTSVANTELDEDGYYGKLIVKADYMYRINTNIDRLHWWNHQFDIPDSVNGDAIGPQVSSNILK